MSKVFFTSDQHFGHRAICKYRMRFKTTQEHDELLIERWNSVVKKRNHFVWVLGDMCIKNGTYDFNLILQRLNGTIWIITGNHDWLNAYQNTELLRTNEIKVWNGIYKRYGY